MTGSPEYHEPDLGRCRWCECPLSPSDPPTGRCQRCQDIRDKIEAEERHEARIDHEAAQIDHEYEKARDSASESPAEPR